jgi:hypothetical protein
MTILQNTDKMFHTDALYVELDHVYKLILFDMTDF